MTKPSAPLSTAASAASNWMPPKSRLSWPTVAVAPPRRAARPLRRVLAVAAAFAVAFSIGGGVLAAAPELRQSLSILGG